MHVLHITHMMIGPYQQDPPFIGVDTRKGPSRQTGLLSKHFSNTGDT